MLVNSLNITDAVKLQEKLSWIISESQSLKGTDVLGTLEDALCDLLAEIGRLEDEHPAALALEAEYARQAFHEV